MIYDARRHQISKTFCVLQENRNCKYWSPTLWSNWEVCSLWKLYLPNYGSVSFKSVLETFPQETSSDPLHSVWNKRFFPVSLDHSPCTTFCSMTLKCFVSQSICGQREFLAYPETPMQDHHGYRRDRMRPLVSFGPGSKQWSPQCQIHYLNSKGKVLLGIFGQYICKKLTASSSQEEKDTESLSQHTPNSLISTKWIYFTLPLNVEGPVRK